MGQVRTTATKACMSIGTSGKGNGFSGSSEAHCLRDVVPDYVIDDETLAEYGITEPTEHWTECSVEEKRNQISERYENHVGQKMQAKAIPFREAVVNMNEHTTMEQLQEVCKRIEKSYGVHAFQIHIHNDEGRICNETGDFLQNRHAHIFFDWTCQETGISKRFKNEKRTNKKGEVRNRVRQGVGKRACSHIQDIVSEVLNMERGEIRQDPKRGVSHWAYKVEQEKQRLEDARKIIAETIESGKDTIDEEVKKYAEESARTANQAIDNLNNTLQKQQKQIAENAETIELLEIIDEEVNATGIPTEIVDDNDKKHKLNLWERFKAMCGIEIEVKNISCSAINVNIPSRPVVKAFYTRVWFMWNKQMKKWFNPTTKPTLTEEETNKRLQQGVKAIDQKKKGVKIGR